MRRMLHQMGCCSGGTCLLTQNSEYPTCKVRLGSGLPCSDVLRCAVLGSAGLCCAGLCHVVHADCLLVAPQSNPGSVPIPQRHHSARSTPHPPCATHLQVVYVAAKQQQRKTQQVRPSSTRWQAEPLLLLPAATAAPLADPELCMGGGLPLRAGLGGNDDEHGDNHCSQFTTGALEQCNRTWRYSVTI